MAAMKPDAEQEAQMISYTGGKTRLRPVRAADKECSIRWRNDPEVRDAALGYRFPVTELMEDAWYQSVLNDQSRTRAVFAIEDLADDLLVGFVQLNRIDWIGRTAWFAIVIGEKARQGKGLASDATHVILRYAFGALNLRKVCLEVPGFNTRARRLYDAIGFRLEGTQRAQVYLEGEYHDLHLMGLLRDEYLARQGNSSA
jgi:RimJ/RimL family protein N-acetyltransferase